MSVPGSIEPLSASNGGELPLTKVNKLSATAPVAVPSDVRTRVKRGLATAWNPGPVSP